MVQFSKKVDNTNVRVCFAEDGEVVMHVTDFKNLGYQYMMATGSNDFIICQNCGTVVKKNTVKPNGYRQNSGQQKYCNSCAAEISVQQSVNSVMRFRGTSCINDGVKRYSVYMHVFPDGKRYVGMTGVSLHERWNNGHGYRGMEIDSAINRVGWANIRHYLLFEGLDKNSARFVENYMINKYRTYNPSYGYNVQHKTRRIVLDDMVPKYINVEVDGYGVKIANK
jgi:hypothetical protein